MGEEQKSPELSRRELLGKALTGAAVVAGYSCFGLKDAVAQFRKAGKPVFSVAALNELFGDTPNAQYKQLLAEAARDPQGFVRSHFTLTAAQEKDLNGLTPQDLGKIREAAGTAQRENLRFRSDCGVAVRLPQNEHFSFVKESAIGPASPQSRPSAQQQRPQSRAAASAAAGNTFAGTLTLNMSGFAR
jgi:hypothetical protein